VLKQEDFLKLLVAQLTSQDPMNPKADMDFITQMAQFSSLEQSQTMVQEIGAMRADSSVSQASSLLGRTVVLKNGDSFVKGQVASVLLAEDGPRIVVNTQTYSLDKVITIMPAAEASPK
jgi:flagellar basal-body rod modification protein FlgD